MPAIEVEVDVELVRLLLEDQRPDLARSEIRPLASGWDNVSFRVGDDRVVRLPRRAVAAGLIANEARWLPQLAPRLPLPVPAPEFMGEPSGSYPWRWLIAPYVPGLPAGPLVDLDTPVCAIQIGRFLSALHQEAPIDAPRNPFRGGPLSDRADATRERFAAVSKRSERARLMELWAESLAAERHQQSPVWLHGDLHPQNVLVVDGQVSGVIDFGDITAGDPATDLAVAWSLVATEQEAFWAAYGSDDGPLQLRSRGWAIALGLAYLSNSADNPVMGQIGEQTLGAVLDLS